MRKKMKAVLFAGAMVFSVCGCGKQEVSVPAGTDAAASRETETKEERRSRLPAWKRHFRLPLSKRMKKRMRLSAIWNRADRIYSGMAPGR